MIPVCRSIAKLLIKPDRRQVIRNHLQIGGMGVPVHGPRQHPVDRPGAITSVTVIGILVQKQTPLEELPPQTTADHRSAIRLEGRRL